MALLSPRLEEMVFEGNAVVKTTVVGKSGQGVLTVTEDKTIIIVEFDYQNFVDALDPDNPDEILERSVHQISFKSKKSRNHFIVRDALYTTTVGFDFRDNVNGTYKKTTFLVHTGSVIVQIVAAPPTIGTISTPGVAPSSLGPERPPSGYGTGVSGILQTVNESDAAGGTEYSPLTSKFVPFTLASPFNVSQMLFPVNVGSALNPTLGTPFGQRSYPIVNITYVEILRNVTTKLFTSS